MKHSREEILEILNNNLYIVLGTCIDDKPWTSPLFYSHDPELNLYWLSKEESKHSKNISKNSNVSITCFDSTSPKWSGKGLYMQAVCNHLKDQEEISFALDLIFSRLLEPVPDADEYLNKGFKIYKAVPKKAWVSSENEIFERIEVSLTS